MITPAGHSLAHNPQPTHRLGLITACMPFGTVMAFLGQTFMQQPQATHSRMLTEAFRFAMIISFLFFYSGIILEICVGVSDEVTVGF